MNLLCTTLEYVIILMWYTKKNMPKVVEGEILARKKPVVRIHPHLHKKIKVLAAVNDAEIGLLTEELIRIGLEQFEQNRVVA